MKLFHYSTNNYAVLKTRKKQNNLTPEERERGVKEHADNYKLTGIDSPGYYFEHISFFFERPPIDRMSKVFPSGHPFWFKGNRIFEHVVNSETIGQFDFEVVEFPEKTEIYYGIASDEEYHRQLKALTESHGYIGKNNAALESAVDCNALIGKTGEYYDLMKTRPNFDEIKSKYAPTVPHVMIYPWSGIAHPSKIMSIVVY